MAEIRSNIDAVRAEIRDACLRAKRQIETVSIIAVTKSQGPEVLTALLAGGLADFGENRIDHLQLMHGHAPAGARFHAIGRVQSRQLPVIVECCESLHSLCDITHARKLATLTQAAGKRLSVFLQVNASAEASKAGMAPQDAAPFLGLMRQLPGLEVVGLMTIAPEMPPGQPDDGRIRACFRTLSDLGKRLGLPRLSMGMSQDFGIAIEEGATDVRIGTRLFA